MNRVIAGISAAVCVGTIVLGQNPAPAPAPQHGPGVQATRDSEYAAWMSSKCKISPPAPAAPRGGGGAPGAGAGGGAGRGGGGGFGGGGGNTGGPPAHRDYSVA